MIYNARAEDLGVFKPRINYMSRCNHKDSKGKTRFKYIGIVINKKRIYYCVNCGAEKMV